VINLLSVPPSGGSESKARLKAVLVTEFNRKSRYLNEIENRRRK